MNIGYVTAIAALAGAALGGLTSFATSWTTLRAQTKAQRLSESKSLRQKLYKQFIEDASKAYADSLMNDKLEFSGIVGLYALVSRMRIQSTMKVTESADRIVRQVVDTYFEPNKTLTELQRMVHDGGLDPLKGFSDVCRNELETDFFI
ncbi:MAG: hypothetical protein QOH96_1225 [Blastocatellia bacterium]|nr:hypothetical protein [Blastocatellia bacterium]